MPLASWLRRPTRSLPSRRKTRTVRLEVEPLEERAVPSAFLVKDINTNTIGSNPSNLTAVNGTLLFTATDNSGNTGLWRSSGTAAGTTLVREFTSDVENLVNVNGTLFFDVSGNPSAQLWESDGTAGDTTLVHDFGGPGLFARGAIGFQNRLYFSFQNHLWASNGTDAGTAPIDPAELTGPIELTAVNGQLFFGAYDPGASTNKLWVTDGTAAHTHKISADVPDAFSVRGLTNANGTLCFFASVPNPHRNDPVNPDPYPVTHLYQSDGTTTKQVDTGSGFGSFLGLGISFPGGQLFFTAGTYVYDPTKPPNPFPKVGLWTGTVSNGAATISSGPFANTVSPSGPGILYAVNNQVVCNNGPQIWTSDGTAAGTMELQAGALPTAGFANETALSANGNTLYFGVIGSRGGQPYQQLWQTDGTVSGTHVAANVTPFNGGTPLFGLTFVGRTLFFDAADPAHGNELWSSDLTTAHLVKDINTDTLGSSSDLLTNAGGTLFFTASSDPTPFFGSSQIWKSDGTAAGTTPATAPAFSGTPDSPLVNVNGMVFFSAINDTQLWVTNGTPGGTTRLMDFGMIGGGLDNLTAAGNLLFFTVPDINTGLEDLWKSDGTAAGTQQVRDNVFVLFGNRVAAGGTFFFVGLDFNTFAFQLWESDGTAGGTHVVDPNNPGTSSLDLFSALTNVKGTLFFFDQSASGNDLTLWRTDGTTATLVTHVHPGDCVSDPYDVIAANHTLYFAVTDNSTGVSELWASDGTAGGTGPVAEVQPDFGFGNAAAVGGRLFFTATDPVQGEQLWVSDGTAPGTALVTNITAGPHDPFEPPSFNLTAFKGKAFFTASDLMHSAELWSSDGTAAGTALVQDINPGSAGSNPSQLTVVGNALFFTATDLAHGTELWAYRPGTPAPITAAVAAAASDRAAPASDPNGPATLPPGRSASFAGPFTSTLMTGPGCPSPVGICTLGLLTGDMNATDDFTMLTLLPAGDPNDPTKFIYTDQSVITTQNGTQLLGMDTGVIHIGANGIAPFTTTVHIVGGTRAYRGAMGQIVATGVLDFNTGKAVGTYAGSITRAQDSDDLAILLARLGVFAPHGKA